MSARIGSIQDFYQWAKSQNPDETYNYFDSRDCACARYAKDRGIEYRPEGSVPGFLGDHIDPKMEQAAMQMNVRWGDLDGTINPSKLTMSNLVRELKEHFLHA